MRVSIREDLFHTMLRVILAVEELAFRNPDLDLLIDREAENIPTRELERITTNIEKDV